MVNTAFISCEKFQLYQTKVMGLRRMMGSEIQNVPGNANEKLLLQSGIGTS